MEKKEFEQIEEQLGKMFLDNKNKQIEETARVIGRAEGYAKALTDVFNFITILKEQKTEKKGEK